MKYETFLKSFLTIPFLTVLVDVGQTGTMVNMLNVSTERTFRKTNLIVNNHIH